ncbi:hypothetical protein K438DRAFT_364894 [Mycena galopus ATCC 62051]|nr:hypothetical protein K438DRAFT_364894 [Mycena galopus ATCC 62051]
MKSTGTDTAEQRAILAKVKSEIGRCKDELEALEEKQREVEESLSLVVYPILTVPNEITSRIFVACLPSEGLVRPSSHAAPLLLAQICGHWRDIALSTCQIWASIDLESFRSGKTRRLLKTWLSRAKKYPLSLAFRDHHDHRVKLGPRPRHLAFIATHAKQLQRLELHISRAQLEGLLPFPHFPKLQSLAVTAQDSHDQDLQGLIDNAPNIRQLVLFQAVRDSPQVIPWSPSLTRLQLDRAISPERMVEVLKDMSLLTHLQCVLSRPSTSSPLPTIFPKLRSLALNSAGEDFAMLALNFLTLPSLQDLDIFGTFDENVFVSFTQRSACELSDLRFDLTDWFSEADGLSEAMCAVVRLEIMAYDTESTINVLNWIHSESAEMFPVLRELRIGASLLHIHYNELIDLLHSLRAFSRPVQLESFHLKFYDAPRRWQPTGVAASALRKLIVDGLKLAIEYDEKKSWPQDYPYDTEDTEPFSSWQCD